MPKNPTDRHDGQQVKLWVSDELYAALKVRAVRQNSSVAEELRKAASAGLEPLNGMDTIQDLLTDLKQFTKLHLEPLAFIAAMDTAYNAASWQQLWKNTPQFQHDSQGLAKMEHQLRQQATQRLQRKLRELPGEDAPENEDEGE